MKRTVMILAVLAGVASLVLVARGQESRDDDIETGRPQAEEGEGTLSEREREKEQKRMAEHLRALRSGKSTVTAISKLAVGLRELVTVTVERDEARLVLVIPQVRKKRRGPWETHPEILKAVRRLRRIAVFLKQSTPVDA